MMRTGVYFGWSTVNFWTKKSKFYRTTRHIYKTAISIGFNPFFANKRLSIELHFLGFPDVDLYGAHIHTVIVGYLHKMGTFLKREDQLRQSIEDDKVAAGDYLSQKKYSLTKEHAMFLLTSRTSEC